MKSRSGSADFTVCYTPGGLAWVNRWGSLRHTSNIALLAAVYARELGADVIASPAALAATRRTHRCWADPLNNEQAHITSHIDTMPIECIQRPHPKLIVRVEDFKAGWSLGGVVLGPSQMDTMKSAFGTDRCTIKYPEVLADLDTMGAAKATALVMTNKMGPITARFKGFTQDVP
ncbi:endoglucanase [Haematococcus lacustris]|uniref:Endoglucanase n=1 Tax=Haematococcus lacustris TaxID=44745 RepID=A0A699Y999_HAELA|nr:endoglucanase [Haematococcus lacustris]